MWHRLPLLFMKFARTFPAKWLSSLKNAQMEWNKYNKLKLIFYDIYFPFIWTTYMIFQSTVSLPSKSKKPSSIFTHRTTTDIILKIEDYEFHAHREVLASRSRVLKKFLKQNTSNMVSVFIKRFRFFDTICL